MKRALCFALLLVSACAQVELQPPGQNVDFDVLARIAARYGSEAFTGNVAWRHARSGDEMLISTPLGQGVARIVREGHAVQLTTAEQQQYRAPDAESLTQRVLGFRLPLEGLADWVQGRASQESPARTEKGANGELRLLEQRGWRVEYQEYERGRPARMRLTYEGVELRLAISEWR